MRNRSRKNARGRSYLCEIQLVKPDHAVGICWETVVNSNAETHTYGERRVESALCGRDVCQRHEEVHRVWVGADLVLPG